MSAHRFTLKNKPKIWESCWFVKLSSDPDHCDVYISAYTGGYQQEEELANCQIFPAIWSIERSDDPGSGYAAALRRAKAGLVDMMPVPQLDGRDLEIMRYLKEPETAADPRPFGYFDLLAIVEKHLLPFINLAEGAQQNEE